MKKSIQRNISVKKAVIPAAGLGSRLGALSALTPKELLPLVNKPSLAWILDEAENAGIHEICLIISPSKNEVMQKFISQYPTKMKIDLIMQRRAGGLGHAILAAERWVGDEPFAVILPDDFLLGEDSLGKLIEAHNQTGVTILALSETPQLDLVLYGVADTKKREDEFLHVLDIVEKPALGSAPSNLSVVGRYVLTKDIWKVLHQEALTANGEIQLTSAIQSLATDARVIAVETSGERHDIGNQAGWLKANIAFAKWIADGSKVNRQNQTQEFSDFLYTQKIYSSEDEAPVASLKNALNVKKNFRQDNVPVVDDRHQLPQISSLMWETAFMDLIPLNLIYGLKNTTQTESLRAQWNRFKENPAASSPYVILFEDQTGLQIIDGHQRVFEMKAIGMLEIPAWIVRPLNFPSQLARL